MLNHRLGGPPLDVDAEWKRHMVSDPWTNWAKFVCPPPPPSLEPASVQDAKVSAWAGRR